MRLEFLLQFIVPLTFLGIWFLTTRLNRAGQPSRSPSTRGPGRVSQRGGIAVANEDSIKLIPLSFSRAEMMLVSNALNEVCNGVHFTEAEFNTRLGASRQEALALLRRVAESLGDDGA
jgi:hypothetical protein